jgi:hypothetical protein
MRTATHPDRCGRSEALGRAFPDLVGGALGLAAGLAHGTSILARRALEGAIWMDRGRPPQACPRCATVHVWCVNEHPVVPTGRGWRP